MRRTHAELVAANAAIREVLDSGAEKALRALPGVTHVSVGLKERGGRVTDELCIRVYVREKRPDETLAPRDRVPRQVDGVPTDVNVPKNAVFTLVNTERFRPVKGGILISNRILGLNDEGDGPALGVGTFGCTATRNSDGDVMLLSNWHVLTAHGAALGARIYQPTSMSFPQYRPDELPIKPTSDDDVIAKISRFAITNKVDAAIARIEVSTCCRCCGIDWRDEIVGLSVADRPPSNKLLGQRPVVAGETVFKVGIRTGRTEGVVTDPAYPDMTVTMQGQDFPFTGQIEIASSGDDDLEPFSLEGDSGAVVVGEDGFAVGLLFAGFAGNVLGERRSYANHIADVVGALGISLNLDRSTHDTAAAAAPVRAFRPSDAEVELYAEARARLRGDPAGEWLWSMAEAHREEVVHLVTRHRPVTVAWHRAGGPALFARALEGLKAGDDALPALADGRTLEEALARVGAALRAHGSPALREAIDAHGDAVLAAVRGATTAGEVLEALRARSPASMPTAEALP